MLRLNRWLMPDPLKRPTIGPKASRATRESRAPCDVDIWENMRLGSQPLNLISDGPQLAWLRSKRVTSK